MAGRIFPRDGLWPAEQRDLERQPFNDPNEEQAKTLKAAYDTMLETKQIRSSYRREITIINGLAFPNVENLLDGNPTADIFKDEDKFPPLIESTVDLYMEALCTYVNKLRCTEDPISQPLEDTNNSYSTREQQARTNERFLSCKFIKYDDFEHCCLSENKENPKRAALEVLQKINCTGEEFMSLDYLFIAFYQPYIGNGHYSLLGIAPKQKFMFAIDSLYYQEYSILREPLIGVLNILRSQVDDDEVKDWPVFAQWSMRPKYTKDKSPTAADQRDSYNCAVFTVVNAFCLAFGFDLMSYTQADLDPLKRPRMFLELSTAVDKCFAGECAYDMLDIPDGPLYKSPTPESSIASEDGEIYDTGEYKSAEIAVSSEEEDVLVDSDQHDDTQDGLEHDDDQPDSSSEEEEDVGMEDDEHDDTQDSLEHDSEQLDSNSEEEKEEDAEMESDEQDDIQDGLEDDEDQPDSNSQKEEDAEMESDQHDNTQDGLELEDDQLDSSSQEQRGISPSQEVEQDSKIPPSLRPTIDRSKVRDTESANRMTVFILRLAEMYRERNLGKRYHRRTEVERRDYPPQFNRHYCQKLSFSFPCLRNSHADIH
ncbi:hypothetical protein VTL71DRAFT_3251 [Oculimacula yallundae]|uniref:Ubiquitin-like protease family profile domain-containing protein n=1 Tax=Oculimacula yallundae TaxID=86028 RepID=A0ABR4C8G1_9HELO